MRIQSTRAGSFTTDPEVAVATASTPDAVADGEPVAGAAHRSALWDWVRLLRPRQWLKSGFVLAPVLFSGRGLDGTIELRALAAFALFSALASGVYLFNDVADRASDMAHPTKRHRPVASGAISPRAAGGVSAVLLTLSIAGGWALAPGVGAVMLAYLAINLLYTYRLKRVVIVDVFAIASFFVLRLLCGAAAIGVRPSVWLLLCGGLLALYLGFAKRRHELVLLGEGSADHRAVLSQYSTAFLDQISVVLLAVTIVSYIMYTLTSATAAEVGSEVLSYSTIFVLYGVFRYLFLVHHARGGGDAAEMLLTDRALVAAVVCWALYCGYVVYR